MRASTKRVVGAVAFGVLTLVATTIVNVLAIPVLIFAAFSPQAKYLGLTVLQWLIALTGDAIVTFISHRVLRRGRLALLTLAVAIATQATTFSLEQAHTRKIVARHSAARDSLRIGLARIIQGYAALGPARYEAGDAVDRDRENFYPELGPLYGTIKFTVPVSVREAGVYSLRLRYDVSTEVGGDPIVFHSGPLMTTDSLAIGNHELSVTMALEEGVNYNGIWSPSSTGGSVTAELFTKPDYLKLGRAYRDAHQGMDQPRLEELANMEAGANVDPSREMKVDSVVTAIHGGARYPKGSRWGAAPRAPRLTDKQEEELRRKGKVGP